MNYDFETLRERAKNVDDSFKLVLTKDKSYCEVRKIANSRILRGPAAVAYCTSRESVAECVKFCSEREIDIRVQSGGHHHEGMCSADYALVVDLSKMNKIDLEEQGADGPRVSIGPGSRLGDVYDTLEEKHWTIPGGGCSSVCAGGLIQGGGWGLLVRKRGLTCDNLLEAEVVLADGRIVVASKEENKDLFWALRGGGGGNFGIVTEFVLRPFHLQDFVTSFSLRWDIADKSETSLIKTWMRFQSDSTENLTTFARVSPSSHENAVEFSMGGQFLGKPQELRKILQRFYDLKNPHFKQYRTLYYADVESAKDGEFLGANRDAASNEEPNHEPSGTPGLSLMISSLAADLQPVAAAVSAPPRQDKAPSSTCDQPHPHKVSSAFPKSKGDYDLLAEKIYQFMSKVRPDETVNKYLSLHGFGGRTHNVASEKSAFPYREKDVLFQFQAWWSDPENEEINRQHVEWIGDFRNDLKDHLEGAFINFVDKLLVEDPDKQRIELLRYYYSDNLPKLRKVKKDYDPHNFFRFGMSIPLPEDE